MEKIDDGFLTVLSSVIRKETKADDATIKRICNTLSDVAGGEVIYISRLRDEKLTERNIKIKKDYHRGLSVKELSIRYELSCRSITRIIST